MKPIFGLQFGDFPIYKLMIIIGCFVGMLVFNGVIKNQPISKYVKKRVRNSLFLGALSGLIISNMSQWLIMDGVMDLPIAERFAHGGFSVYFGMLGFFCISAVFLFFRRLQIDENLGFAVIPLIISQMIWRLGCALRGCCFGIGEDTPIPVRLIEILALLGIAIFLRVRKNKQHRVTIYLFAYSLLRFGLEFLRGDERGSLFGFDLITPTQAVALAVVLVSGGCLLFRAITRIAGTEDNVEAFFAKLKRIFHYKPYPQDFAGTRSKLLALRIIVGILVVILLITAVFAAWNPLSLPIFDEFSDTVNTWLFAEKGRDDPVGDSDSVSVIDVSNAGKIENADMAMSLISSYDSFIDVDLIRIQPLSENSRVYVFQQAYDGKPILGTECALVTDYDGNAQYIISDAANRVYSTTPNYYGSNTEAEIPTFEGYSAVETKECWYNSGEGLREAKVTLFGKSDTEIDFGVIIDRSSGEVLSLTDSYGKTADTMDRLCILTAISEIKAQLNDKDKIKDTSKRSVSETGYSAKLNTLTRAMARAYIKSGLSADEYEAIIDSSRDIVCEMSTVSVYTFRDLFAEETVAYLRNAAKSEDDIDSAANKIEKAFESSGIKQKSDEVATTITVRERKGSFNYKMDHIGDRDLYVVNAIEGQATEIVVNSSTPISVEISRADGTTITDMWIEGEEKIPLSPEDGESYAVRVIDKRTVDAKDKPSKYSISVVSIPEENEENVFVNYVLGEFEKAYNNSNLSLFFMYITDQYGEPFSGEEIISAGMSAPVEDACSKSCHGEGDGYDSAKEFILTHLIIDYPDSLEVDADDPETVWDVMASTRMELNSVDIKTDDDVIYVKAYVGLYIKGFYLYEGYSFLQFNKLDNGNDGFEPSLDENTDGVDKVNEMSEWLFTEFQRDGYYVTAFNTEEIAAAFGNTLADQQHTTQLTSLYSLWETYTKEEDGLSIKLRKLNTDEALLKGHSPEKVEGFNEFIYRKNLADLKELRYETKYLYDQCKIEMAFLDITFFAMDCATGKWKVAVAGKLLDVAGLGLLGTIGKLVSGDIEGAIEDQAQEALKLPAKELVPKLKHNLDILDRWIAEYERTGKL